MLPDSSPPDPIFSSFSVDGQGDEEAAIGKLVSMSLINAIAATECLSAEVLVTQLLPEVDRMKTESMFYVRKEAVQALASLANCLPVEVFEEKVVRADSHTSSVHFTDRTTGCIASITCCIRTRFTLARPPFSLPGTSSSRQATTTEPPALRSDSQHPSFWL
jgi:hypothetical protein